MKKEFISLLELGMEMGIPKSKLSYYRQCGLIVPAHKVSNTDIFKYDETVKRINKIEKLQKEGLTIKKILNKLNQTKQPRNK